MKAESIQKIMEISDYKSFLSRRENQLFLDLAKYDGRRETLTAYFENFCDQADSVVSSVLQPSFTVYLDALLVQKGKENNLKPSIKEFVNHEISIVEKEYQLMEAFRSRARNKKYQSDVYEIAICSLSLLSFLENPFPAV